MKKIIVATLLALSLAASALAKPAKVVACTADKKIATLNATVQDTASRQVLGNIAFAFTRTAFELTAEGLLSMDGYNLFISRLTQETIDAITALPTPVITEDVNGACKKA